MYGICLLYTSYIICHAIKIKELNVSSKFGMGNPMYTGIATGAVNAGVYNACLLYTSVNLVSIFRKNTAI